MNSDFAPAFDSPRLEGPVVKEIWVEFYCVVPTNETRKDAAFNVTFLFDGRPNRHQPSPSFILQPPYLKATLHEKYLAKNLGKWVSLEKSIPEPIWSKVSIQQDLTQRGLDRTNSNIIVVHRNSGLQQF